MKYLVGFIIGVMVSAAVADDIKTGILNAVMAAGVGPDGNMAQIKVDANGHAICANQEEMFRCMVYRDCQGAPPPR